MARSRRGGGGRRKPLTVTVTLGGPRPKARRARRSSGSGSMASLTRALSRAIRGSDRPAAYSGPAGSPEHVLYDSWGRPRRFGR